MKKLLSLGFAVAALALLVSSPAMAGGKPTLATLIAPYDPLVDQNGNDISSDPNAPLYGALCNIFFGLPNLPILAPDGHHVTVGEWTQATGRATAKCTPKGTHLSIHLKNLIPNGVYTMWLAVFEAPGYDFDWTHAIAVGTLGLSDGSQATLHVSASGEAQLNLFQKAGPLSMKGAVSGCLLDEFEFQLVLAYHLDGLTSGGVPSSKPNGDCWIGEQLGFHFSNH